MFGKFLDVALPLNIAHRGARSIAPENTLAAARKGYESGAHMMELDVAMSADGEVVVIHDDTLERTTNVKAIFPDRSPWRVADFTWEELSQLDAGSWFVEKDPFGQIAAGKVSEADQESFKGERIPKLMEILEYTKANDWALNIEIKDQKGTAGDGVIVDRVVEMVKALDMEEKILISSFQHNYLRQVRKLSRKMDTGALVGRPYLFPGGLLRTLNVFAYHPHYRMINVWQIKALRSKGHDVNIWTVNDETVMRKLIASGASGVITDFPQLMRELLAEYQITSEQE
jgi:glycerophosphoryl diester phosphodiesterase